MAIDTDLLLVLTSSGLGEGEPDLGEKLMNSFLQMLFDSGRIPVRIIFMNSGIFLTTAGTPVAGLLDRYEKAGSEILSCGTCLDYYGRADKLIIGKPTTMKVTVASMLDFEKVLSPR